MVERRRVSAGRVLLVTIGLIAAFTLMACGGGGEKTSTDPHLTPAGPGNAFSVTISDSSITPASMAARMGTVHFTIKNTASQPRSLFLQMNGISYQSPQVAPGQSITWSIPLGTPSPQQIFVRGPGAGGLEANLYVATGGQP